MIQLFESRFEYTRCFFKKAYTNCKEIIKKVPGFFRQKCSIDVNAVLHRVCTTVEQESGSEKHRKGIF